MAELLTAVSADEQQVTVPPLSECPLMTSGQVTHTNPEEPAGVKNAVYLYSS